MNGNTKIIAEVPTNISTGFLGVGKSTAILHLLKNKPNNERWAVLVNEFGEIGVHRITSNLRQRWVLEEQFSIVDMAGHCVGWFVNNSVNS